MLLLTRQDDFASALNLSFQKSIYANKQKECRFSGSATNRFREELDLSAFPEDSP